MTVDEFTRLQDDGNPNCPEHVTFARYITYLERSLMYIDWLVATGGFGNYPYLGVSHTEGLFRHEYD